MTAAATAVPTLVATRRLAMLDEHAVPYAIGDEPGAGGGGWASLGAAEGARVHWWTGTGAAVRWTLDGSPLVGPLAPPAEVEALVERLPGIWAPALPVAAPGGAPLGALWRSTEGGTILPFDPDAVALTLRSEAYRAGGGRSALSRRAYYRLRPLLPRRAQIALRRALAPVQARSAFPRWPAEPALHDLGGLVLAAVADAAGAPVPVLAPWPAGHDWALVLTHDAETAKGRDAIARVRAVEQRHGLRSSWNLVPERYDVDDALVAGLHAEGCEVGVHGLRHDGRDLESAATLARRLPAMRAWAERWGAVGFRAPATHRVWDWMPGLGFAYDSSSPDTDPYEPMAGGCCSWLPFFNADLIELPITLPQDHTLFVILRRDEALWLEKVALLRDRGGMALLITHPDYLTDDEALDAYARFLDHVAGDGRAWRALPCEVADWWRRRAATRLLLDDGMWRPEGPAAGEAVVRLVPGGRGATTTTRGWG